MPSWGGVEKNLEGVALCFGGSGGGLVNHLTFVFLCGTLGGNFSLFFFILFFIFIN